MQVIIKPTTACNGNCVYCAASATSQDASPLREEQLPPLMDTFGAWLRADPSRSLGFIWHGGEPLLLGLDFYRAVYREQQRAFGDDQGRVRNLFQSNLTLLTEAWLPFLRRFVHGGLGTSFDIVDGIRGLRSEEPLAEKWLHALDLCREAGISVGVVYVVHRRSLPLAPEIYHFFRNLDPRLGVRFNPLYREGRATAPEAEDLAVTPEEYGRFLVEIAELWWNDGRRTSVVPHLEWLGAWQGNVERLCCESSGRCHETHLGIGPDGTAFTCGRYSDHRDPETRLGNVFEDSLQDILAHPTRTAMTRRSAGLLQGPCEGCRYWSVCHGGCPMMARLYYDDPLRETYFCEARKHVYRFFEERLGPPRVDGGLPGGDAAEDWL